MLTFSYSLCEGVSFAPSRSLSRSAAETSPTSHIHIPRLHEQYTYRSKTHWAWGMQEDRRLLFVECEELGTWSSWLDRGAFIWEDWCRC